MTDDAASRQLIEAGQHFDIWRLLSAPRHENEAMLRALCRSVYLGDNVALCRVLGRYKMYVDTRDLSISSHLLLEGYWEMWVTEAMMRHVRPGMTVLDIGANLGYFTLLLADLVGHEGRVLAFEPNPEMASRTRRSISVNGFGGRATLHEVALADRDGEMLLDVVDDMPGGGHLVAMTEPPEAAPPVPSSAVAAEAPAAAPVPYAPLPRPVRAPLDPVHVALPPPARASGLFARLAALAGLVPASALAEQRAAMETAVAAANSALNEAAQQRIEAALVEAVAAAELSAGARVAAAQAAAAADMAARAAAAIGQHAVAAIDAAAGRRADRAASGQSLHRVPVRRLDEIPGALEADFIKMDVEGAEQMVWSGMGGLLDRGRALTIFMEFTIERFADPHGFLDEIERRGFSMAIIDFTEGVVPISRETLFARSHAIDNMLVFSRGEQGR